MRDEKRIISLIASISNSFPVGALMFMELDFSAMQADDFDTLFVD